MPPRYSQLPNTAAIEIDGADAVSFLNAQLSRDVEWTAKPEAAVLAGWHDASGRVRALFRVLAVADGRMLLILERALLASVLQRLKMFVLRSRVTVSEAPQWHFGALLDAQDWLAGRAIARLAPGSVARHGEAWLIGVGQGLVQAAGSAEALAALAAELPQAPTAEAELAAIRLGVPALSPVVSEKFVAQMLGLERLGALSFTKGCYPGQEVVARLHYRGSVKRQLRRFVALAAGHGARTIAPGATLLDASNDTEAGIVISAASDSDGRVELLAVVADGAARVRTAEALELIEQDFLPLD